MQSCSLSEDLLTIMRVVKAHGGTHCSGTCHHRKPGEFHCHTISQMLGISSSGVKQRLRDLMEMGLMERRRAGGEAANLVTFVVSAEGEKVLAEYENRTSS